MERLYGETVERMLFTVRGVREVSQVARSGRLVATVIFDWDVDLDVALVDVQKAVGGIEGDVDVDEVLVRRFDPRQSPPSSRWGLSHRPARPTSRNSDAWRAARWRRPWNSCRASRKCASRAAGTRRCASPSTATASMPSA